MSRETTHSPSAPPAPRRVVLVRGSHRWTVECDGAGSGPLLARLRELADLPGAPLDLFDLALIRRQIAEPAPGALKPGLYPAD
jgi:hypothetical protein